MSPFTTGLTKRRDPRNTLWRFKQTLAFLQAGSEWEGEEKRKEKRRIEHPISVGIFLFIYIFYLISSEIKNYHINKDVLPEFQLSNTEESNWKNGLKYSLLKYDSFSPQNFKM